MQNTQQNYQLGETDVEIEIDTLDENRDLALALAEQAMHTIDIFTQDLDSAIYNTPAFEQAVFQLSKKHPSTRIRLLVQDSTSAIKNGHRLIRLAQNLTSSIAIHKPSTEHRDESCAFMVVDKIGLLYRANANNRNHKANINFKSPLQAAKLSDQFEEIWQHSSPDMQTRRIYV